MNPVDLSDTNAWGVWLNFTVVDGQQGDVQDALTSGSKNAVHIDCDLNEGTDKPDFPDLPPGESEPVEEPPEK